MSRKLVRYHVQLFEWHSRNFFPFDEALSDAELAYLDASFGLADKDDERPRVGYKHFSYYSYSHRVRGDSVNSTRLAYGTLSKPRQLWPFASRVILDRGIELEPVLPGHSELGFYGLGFDLEARQLKVYFRVSDVDALGESYSELRRGAPPHRPEGLVSATFVGSSVVERKVYFYPTEDETSESSIRRVAMSTSERGLVDQLDVPGAEGWRLALSAHGRRILDLYASVGERLDTIAYEGPVAFTLYFP